MTTLIVDFTLCLFNSVQNHSIKYSNINQYVTLKVFQRKTQVKSNSYLWVVTISIEPKELLSESLK